MRSLPKILTYAAGFLGAALFGWAISSAAQKEGLGVSTNPKFPEGSIEDLNGRALNFPKELPGERTIVLVAFVQQQQRDIDAWVEKLKLKEPNAPAWIELPTVANLGPGFRKFLDSAMQSGIQSKEDRSRVFTLYTDVKAFCRQTGLSSTKTIYALVVDRSGNILATVAGRPTDEGIKKVVSALKG